MQYDLINNLNDIYILYALYSVFPFKNQLCLPRTNAAQTLNLSHPPLSWPFCFTIIVSARQSFLV